MKNYINRKFIIATLIITLFVVPVMFNFIFLWESGFSRGTTSDWFALYGNIFGGLIGGFFTYIALVLTFESKRKEMRPKIDISHQSIEFWDDNCRDFKPIIIELNNIGGSIAKNIECILSLENYETALAALEKDEKHLKIKIKWAETIRLEGNKDSKGEKDKSANLIPLDEEGMPRSSLGVIHKKYNKQFIGSCIPLALNPEAKAKYVLQTNVNNWINYIILKRKYADPGFNKDELFELTLEVKYSSDDYGDFSERFKLEWDFIGIYADGSGSLKFDYVLKSSKVN